MNTEHVTQLTAPFAVNEHEFLRGAIYLTEEAVTRRLDAVDPAWSFMVSRVEHRDDKCVIFATLTVCGVTRESNGMDVSEYKKDSPRVPENEVNQREKAALTDALKRCARMFGIGRYMLDMPRKGDNGAVTDVPSLRAWLKANYGDQAQKPAAPAQPPAQPAQPKADAPRISADEWTKFAAHWNNHAEALNYGNLLDALGIPEGSDDIREWPGSLAEAHAAVARWCVANPKQEELAS